MAVEEFEDVTIRRGGDNGGGDKLIHRFMVLRVGWIVDETCPAGIYCTREEGESYVPVVGYALECAD